MNIEQVFAIGMVAIVATIVLSVMLYKMIRKDYVDTMRTLQNGNGLLTAYKDLNKNADELIKLHKQLK